MLFFCTIFGSLAQKTGFVYYDSLTYRQYINKEYTPLLKTGKKALHAGIDYYYLRMRMGIAAYQQKKYRLAAVHFKNALQYNDNDLVREYLYYSALWGGEPLLAQETEKGMSAALKKKLPTGNSKLLGTEVSLAYLTRNKKIPDDFSIPQQEGYQIIPQQFFDASITLQHKVGTKTQMTHMLTYLNKQNAEYFYKDNKTYYEPSFNTNQFQYYLGTFLGLGHAWSLHLNGQVSFFTQPAYAEVRGRMGSSSYVKTTVWQTDYVLAASLVKNYPRFSLEAGLAAIHIQNRVAWQPSGIFRLFPFANLDFYTVSRFSYLVRNDYGTFFQQQKIGGKILGKLWMEGSYFSGNVSGFTLDNSMLLFNGPEEINRMAGIRFIYLTGSKTKINLGYQYRQQTTYFIPANSDVRTNKADYNYSLFYILVSWSF